MQSQLGHRNFFVGQSDHPTNTPGSSSLLWWGYLWGWDFAYGWTCHQRGTSGEGEVSCFLERTEVLFNFREVQGAIQRLHSDTCHSVYSRCILLMASIPQHRCFRGNVWGHSCLGHFMDMFVHRPGIGNRVRGNSANPRNLSNPLPLIIRSFSTTSQSVELDRG